MSKPPKSKVSWYWFENGIIQYLLHFIRMRPAVRMYSMGYSITLCYQDSIYSYSLLIFIIFMKYIFNYFFYIRKSYAKNILVDLPIKCTVKKLLSRFQILIRSTQVRYLPQHILIEQQNVKCNNHFIDQNTSNLFCNKKHIRIYRIIDRNVIIIETSIAALFTNLSTNDYENLLYG